MNRLFVFIGTLCCSVLSCTMEKTDYRAEIDTVVPEFTKFEEVTSTEYADFKISMDALNGTLYKGYNEVRLKITDTRSGQKKQVSSMTFLPIRTIADGSRSSCPHRYQLKYKPEDDLFLGYAVFDHESSTNHEWEAYLGFTIGNQSYQTRLPLTVKEQPNKNLNMVTFTGDDDQEYVVALVSPQKPKVAENVLLAGIYQFNKPTGAPADAFPDPSQFSYREVKDYTLLLDPRMPEPSMGNHSSPNNVDLTQREDGLYQGVVNYTMTGNWTLNFILLNQDNKILKGTIVPDDFTPGVEGVKSELKIDILF